MGGMERVEREVLVRVMHCSTVGLDDKGGVQSDLPLNGCLGGSTSQLNPIASKILN